VTLSGATQATPCSATITVGVGVGVGFQVTARNSIVFGWEPTSFNQAPSGRSFTVIGFSAG
jgi:hypothetical protein